MYIFWGVVENKWSPQAERIDLYLRPVYCSDNNLPFSQGLIIYSVHVWQTGKNNTQYRTNYGTVVINGLFFLFVSNQIPICHQTRQDGTIEKSVSINITEKHCRKITLFKSLH